MVTIVTPNYLHHPFAKSLLENRFHVICEKPMTMTVEEAVDLEKLVTKTQTDICPDPYLYRLPDGEADARSNSQRGSRNHTAY